jgi:hypothetical protein
MSGLPDQFEPDRFLLERLGAEHQNGTWVGRELLPVATRIRELGGDEDDYQRWATTSHLWNSYVYSTGDTVAEQKRSLEGAWVAAGRSKPWDLEDALTELAARVRSYTGWPNPRTASRDRVVALAFIAFCIDRNCYTRTISSYELAKHTPGMSQKSVHRALVALLDLGLLLDVERTDRRTSTRSTRRYRLFLRWEQPRTSAMSSVPPGDLFTPDLRNSCKSTLSHERKDRDLWSWKGAGYAALRVWEVLTDEPMTVQEVSSTTGQSEQAARRCLKKLFDLGLAGEMPGRPKRYFKTEMPLSALEDALGITGTVDQARAKIKLMQEQNRKAYPNTYRRRNDEKAPVDDVDNDPFAGPSIDLDADRDSGVPPMDWPTLGAPGHQDSGDPTHRPVQRGVHPRVAQTTNRITSSPQRPQYGPLF